HGATTDTTTVTPFSSTTYNVTGTDANGCSATASASVNVTNAMTLSTAVTDIGCGGGNVGAIDLTGNGGQKPFTLSWDSGQNTQNISGLLAGPYSVTVTDATGCQATTSATVNQLAVPLLTETHTNISCNGGSDGSITTSITNATGSPTYLWNDNDVSPSRT